MSEKANWPLGNGQTLAFDVYDRNEGWRNLAGLYIFCCVVNGIWQALYVGQTVSFRDRLPSHERLDEAVKHGATHVHALVLPGKQDRDLGEQMLIKYLQPPLNDQYR